MKYTTKNEGIVGTNTLIPLYIPSKWICYMFGSTPKCPGITYRPAINQVPNFFIRFMMKICFGCTWIKVKE